MDGKTGKSFCCSISVLLQMRHRQRNQFLSISAMSCLFFFHNFREPAIFTPFALCQGALASPMQGVSHKLISQNPLQDVHIPLIPSQVLGTPVYFQKAGEVTGLDHQLSMSFNHHLILPTARYVRNQLELMLVYASIFSGGKKCQCNQQSGNPAERHMTIL